MTSHKPTNKRPELPTVTWHASKYKVHQLQQRCSLFTSVSSLLCLQLELCCCSGGLHVCLATSSCFLYRSNLRWVAFLSRSSLSRRLFSSISCFRFAALTCMRYPCDKSEISLKRIYFSTSLSLARNSGCLTWVRHSSCKSSATHSYWCLQYFPVSRQWHWDCTQGLYGHRKRVCTGS